MREKSIVDKYLTTVRNVNHGNKMRNHQRLLLRLLLVGGLVPTTLVGQAVEPNEAAQAAEAADAAEAAAVTAAESWLRLTDANQLAESWTQAASVFRSAVTTEQWQAAATQVRAQAGTLVSRALKEATFTTTLPHLPEGEYVVIEYQSSFQTAPSAVETVVLINEGTPDWRVAGYVVRPQ